MTTPCTKRLLWLISVVTALCNLLSFSIPGWLVLTNNSYDSWRAATQTTTINYAVWYMRVCADTKLRGMIIENEKCEAVSYHSIRNHIGSLTKNFQLGYIFFVEWELEILFGTLSSLMAVYFIRKWQTADDSPPQPTKKLVVTSFIFSAVGATLNLVPAIRFARLNMAINNFNNYDGLRGTDVGIPYANILAVFGGILGGILALIFLVYSCRSPSSSDGIIQSNLQPQQMHPLMPIQGQQVPGSEPTAPLYPAYQAYPPEQQHPQQPGYGHVQYQQHPGQVQFQQYGVQQQPPPQYPAPVYQAHDMEGGKQLGCV